MIKLTIGIIGVIITNLILYFFIGKMLFKKLKLDSTCIDCKYIKVSADPKFKANKYKCKVTNHYLGSPDRFGCLEFLKKNMNKT